MESSVLLRWLGTSAAIAGVYLVGLLAEVLWKSRRPKDYPPGPKPLPVVGNLHQVGKKHQFLRFTAWRETYGDVVGLKLGITNVVVLNSARAVSELFDKRSDVYSGRSMSGVMQETMRDGPHITMCQSGEFLRQWRTAARLLFRPAGLRDMLPVHNAAAAYCVAALLRRPDAMVPCLRNWALTTPLKAVCGVNGAQQDPEWMAWYFGLAREWFDILEPDATPPLDILPVLRRVPSLLAPWRRKARWVYANRLALYRWTLACAKREYRIALEAGTRSEQESLMTRILREQDGQASKEKCLDDEQLAHLGGGLLEASVGTTLASFQCWLKILLAHPADIQKLQAELDAVCGTDVPPQSDKIEQLPYLKACLQEAWRWRVPTPVSLPHTATADDVYEGHFIPKGTTVLQNNWCILHDPAHYEAPEQFRPARYLAHPAGTRPGAPPGPHSRSLSHVFGAGRRVCPGDGFSSQSMLLLMAKLLWAFDLVAPGPVDVSVETGFHGETVVDPTPFAVRCVPRSAARARAAEEDKKAWEHVLA